MNHSRHINVTKGNGFTLIELMIALAIIGILVTITLPQIQSYFIKAQHSSALEEIMSGKTSMEISFYQELIITTPDQINLQSSSKVCSSITAVNNLTAGTGRIQCTITGAGQIDGAVVTLDRANTGLWTCSSTAPAQYTANCR
jgi:type IV pilus assembly protein PilA